MSKDFSEIKVPQFGVNETTATIVDWKIEDHSRVEKGEILGILETTKAVFDVESSIAGFFIPLVDAGDEVEVDFFTKSAWNDLIGSKSD